MPSWWQQPYRGGGPAQVNGFPRPLYPPSAKNHGKTPSKDGPDVEAYKRTISRLGRWPWQEFDDSYSDAFALGNPSSQVENSGVAGVQRQQDIDDTGWIGSKTYNALCYALVPDAPGFMHPGEQAMDGVAVQLLNEAYSIFGGHEPASEDQTVRQAALQIAVTQLGVKESPADSNKVKYTDWYGMVGPWCAMFCTWCYEKNARGQSPSFVKGERYAYVPYIVADARNGKYGLKTTSDPIPGDLVCYDWDWGGEYDHVGLFERWIDYTNFASIEGNTSTSNDSNGGQVMRRTRSTQSQATTFVRVAEP